MFWNVKVSIATSYDDRRLAAENLCHQTVLYRLRQTERRTDCGFTVMVGNRLDYGKDGGDQENAW